VTRQVQATLVARVVLTGAPLHSVPAVNQADMLLGTR